MNVGLLHFELLQAGLPVTGVSASGRIDYSRALTSTEQTLATNIIAAHNPNGKLPWEQAEADAISGYATLPAWAISGTAAQAETYITEQIFSGQTQAQIDTYIDAQLTNITTANVSQINARLQVTRDLLKLVAGAVITMRGLFIIVAKLLVYMRDLVIRFRKI